MCTFSLVAIIVDYEVGIFLGGLMTDKFPSVLPNDLPDISTHIGPSVKNVAIYQGISVRVMLADFKMGAI